MTKLVVQELLTYLTQEVTLTLNSRKTIDCIRPYLYVHNNPSGTFTFEVINGATTLATASFTASSLYTALSTTDLYAHLFYKPTFDKNIILNNGTYTLKLSHSGYTYSDSSFIGWIQMHDDQINDFTYANTLDNKLPLSFEIYEKRLA